MADARAAPSPTSAACTHRSTGAARARRARQCRATARHLAWVVSTTRAAQCHHTWGAGVGGSSTVQRRVQAVAPLAAPRPRGPAALRQLTLEEAWARARRAAVAAGQLPVGVPTVGVAEALLLGGGVSRPPTCRSSFGIEIGFIDNVDLVKANEKAEAFAEHPRAGTRGGAQQPADKQGMEAPAAGSPPDPAVGAASKPTKEELDRLEEEALEAARVEVELQRAGIPDLALLEEATRIHEPECGRCRKPMAYGTVHKRVYCGHCVDQGAEGRIGRGSVALFCSRQKCTSGMCVQCVRKGMQDTGSAELVDVQRAPSTAKTGGTEAGGS